LLLSGGVDSAILAYELSRLGLTEAFVVGTDPNSPDFVNARAAAKRCGLNLHQVICKTFDIDTSLAVTETRNRSIAEEYVCHLALARHLADTGYRVAFAGSGADELFCGYSYYLRFLNKERYHEVQQRFIQNYHKMDLRVLNKVYMAHAVEIRNPFLSRRLAEYALGLDVKLCLIGQPQVMKLALRRSYEDLIDSANNPKLIACETMGVKARYEKEYGKSNPRIYYERFKEMFNNPKVLSKLVARASEVEYEVT